MFVPDEPIIIHAHRKTRKIVHSRTICNSGKLEMAHMSVIRVVDI